MNYIAVKLTEDQVRYIVETSKASLMYDVNNKQQEAFLRRIVTKLTAELVK